VIVVTCDWDCNKGINNPNDVFSSVTRHNITTDDEMSLSQILSCIDQLLDNDSVNMFHKEPTRAIERLLVGNGSVNTPPQQKRLCFLRGPCKIII
jgi:hypothetical protein